MRTDPSEKDTTLQVDSVAFGGAGVGRLPDGRVCFVHGVLPGERARVRIVKEKRSYVQAVLSGLLESSPRRVKPRCPVFGVCGGCSYQHASYDLQLEIKTAQVGEALRRIGGFAEFELRPAIASPLSYGYRNRISVHTGRGHVGFHRLGSNLIVPVTECPIASPEVNVLLAELSAAGGKRPGRVTLRASGKHRGFSQVNDGAAELLLGVVRGMISQPNVVDAYCGAGFFANALAESATSVTGIEWSRAAVEAARHHAAANQTFLEGPVEEHLPEVLSAGFPRTTALLVDPPAEGLPAAVVSAILARPPAEFVYVSCDPSTLARDLKRLAAAYVIDFVQPVDMFPQTAEIEVAVRCRLS